MTRQNYLRTEHSKRFASIAASLDFEMAIDVAFLAYMEELGVAKDAQDAAARNWKREGAHRFVQILQGIAIPAEVKAAEGVGYREMVKT